MALQLRVLHHLRSSVLVYSSGAVWYCHASERRLLGRYDVVCVQHYDRYLRSATWGIEHWLIRLRIGQVTPIAVTAIGWKFYLVFIVCNFTNAVFFYCFQPETKGLNLEVSTAISPNMNVSIANPRAGHG